jgi:hypothetical protein
MEKNLAFTSRVIPLLLFLILFAGILVTAPFPKTFAATITVDSNADNTTAGDSNCTLREALLNANNGSDTTTGDCVTGEVGIDTVDFSTGMTISPTLGGMYLSTPVYIDATSAGSIGTCSSKDLNVVIDASGNGGQSLFNLGIGSDGSTVKGFVFQNIANAVFIDTSDDHTISCNTFGLNQDGDAVVSNSGNIYIDSATNILIGGTASGDGNVFTGGQYSGVEIHESIDTEIYGNIIGLDITGTVELSTQTNGLWIEDSDGTIIGDGTEGGRNIISGNTTYGITLVSSDNTEIYGNIIGLDITGTVGFLNQQGGIDIEDSDGTIIGDGTEGGRNIISGNIGGTYGFGILAQDGSDNTTIQGNYFGTDITGLIAIPNDSYNIEVCGIDFCGLSTTPIDAVTIGGGTLGEGNIFAPTLADEGKSVQVAGDANMSNILIQGNYFNIGSNGTTLFTDTLNSRSIDFSGVMNGLIGGNVSGEGNIFAGTGGARGIDIDDSSDIEVYGNFIGFLSDGITLAMDGGYTGNGLNIQNSDNITIGGPNLGEGNIVGNNNESQIANIFLYLSDTITIQGNYIGVGSDGIVENSSNSASGVLVIGTTNSTIGGLLENEGNTIGYGNAGIYGLNMESISVIGNTIFGNEEYGVGVATTNLIGPDSTVSILRNSMYGNGSLGIELTSDENGDYVAEVNVGQNTNDSGDTDSGPNDYINHPVLDSVVQSGDDTVVTFSLDVPTSVYPYHIEFFSNPNGLSESGYGEGEVFQDFMNVILSPGSQTLEMTLVSVDANDGITATITPCLDADCLTYGGTSEFSNGIVPVIPSRSTGSSGSRAHYGCKDPTAINYEKFASSKPSLCKYSSGEVTPTLGISGQCSVDKIITQNLKAPSRNGVYNSYTKAVVKEAKILQAHLNRLGFASGPEDGILGPISMGAIKRMQTFLKTIPDGFVGPITRGLINSSCGSKGLQ